MTDAIFAELSEHLCMGQQLLFKIDSFDSNHCLVEGVVDEECLNLMNNLDIFNSDSDIEFDLNSQDEL